MAAGNAVIRKTTTWQQNRTCFQLSAAWEKWDSARESITKNNEMHSKTHCKPTTVLSLLFKSVSHDKIGVLKTIANSVIRLLHKR